MKMKLLITLICFVVSASAGTVAIKNGNHANNQQNNNSSSIVDETESALSEEDKSAVSVTSNTEDKKADEAVSVQSSQNVRSKAKTSDQTVNSTYTTTSKPIYNPPTTSKPNTNTPSKSTSNSSNKVTSVPTTPVNSDFDSFKAEVVRLVNVERKARGLKELTVNAKVTKSATAKSVDMAKNNYFSHTSPTYGSPFDMLKSFGVSYRAAGENIAMGQRTPQEVMNGWMNSPGHKANILNSSFTQIGVGIAKNAKGQLIWTQQFIG